MPVRLTPVCVRYLMKLARAYAEHEQIRLTTVGRYFHGTSTFFVDLERGARSLQVATYDELVAKFHNRWPDDMTWPKEPFRAAKRHRGVS